MVRGVADLKTNTGILYCVQDDDAKVSQQSDRVQVWQARGWAAPEDGACDLLNFVSRAGVGTRKFWFEVSYVRPQ